MRLTKKFVSVALALLMILPCFSTVSFAEEAKSSEHLTEVPEGYVGIYTKTDLNNMRTNRSGKYILMNDIVFDHEDYAKDGSFHNMGMGWSPIGTSSSYAFGGIFDGNGYTISNIYINNPDCGNMGLFGYAKGATIKNLTLKDSNITGATETGGIAGRIYNSTIDNCNFDGFVIGTEYTGGIAGYISGSTINNCNFDGSVIGTKNTGGIAGCSHSAEIGKSTISYCVARGTVTGSKYVGGIAGYQSSSVGVEYGEFSYSKNNYISYCCNASSVTGQSLVGGITGESTSRCYNITSSSAYTSIAYVEYCCNSGDITAKESGAGGLIGYSDCSANSTYQYLRNSFNCGNVSANSDAGGLIGLYNNTSASNSYSVGNVTAETGYGGFVGNGYRLSISNCYCLDEGIANLTSTSSSVKTKDQLTKDSTYFMWNFETIWTIDGREDYPYPEIRNISLVLPEDNDNHIHSYISEITTPATHLADGVKTYTCSCGYIYTKAISKLPSEVPEGYIGIFTKEDLDSIKMNLSGKYILMNDIVFVDEDYVKGGSFYNSGKGWSPIGTSSYAFKGVFDGNGYTISNLYINDKTDNVGLFGYAEGATIKNLTLKDADITGSDYTGGIAGYSLGSTIESCNFSGSVSGDYYVGGIVGRTSSNDTKTANTYYCNTTGSVTGLQYVGGIAGYQASFKYESYTFKKDNYILYCCNASSVTGNFYVGGISGYSKSNGSNSKAYVRYCSNSGDVIATTSNAGGLIGASYGQSLTYSFNTGYTSAISYAGGLIGYCETTSAQYSYSVGTVTAESDFGGCFGKSPNTVTYCYYLDKAVTEPTCTVGTSKDKDQLKEKDTYEQWNFTTIWTFDGREDYPYPEIIGVDLILPPHKHSHTSEITTPATHLETGVMTFTCACGDTYTEDIAKVAEHTYTSKVTTPATHLKEGVETFTCECGDSYTKPIAKLTDHIYNAVVTEPTCTDKGYTTYTCECGDSYAADYVDQNGHKHESAITTPATHTSEGVMTYTCHCGDTYTESIAKVAEHTYTAKVTTPATHLKEGVETFTCECGNSYTKPIAKIEAHNYKAVVTKPTCEDKGYTTYTCECGNSYVGNYTGATGHDYDSGIVTTKPTCTKTGIKTFTCGNCGDTYTEDVKSLGHKHESTITTPATHTNEGVMTYTCACGDSYTEAIEKITEHNYNAVVTAPTCTEQGYTTYTCECGDSYVDDYVDATGHNDASNDGNCDVCSEHLCDHACHKTGIIGFFWKIVCFFSRIFGLNKFCTCGNAHY